MFDFIEDESPIVEWVLSLLTGSNDRAIDDYVNAQATVTEND
jgi:hypothetical protein